MRFNKSMVIMQSWNQALTMEKTFPEPDQHDASQQRAVDCIEDEDSAGSQNARDLPDGCLHIADVLQHIQANDNGEAAIGIGQRFGIPLLVVGNVPQFALLRMFACSL